MRKGIRDVDAIRTAHPAAIQRTTGFLGDRSEPKVFLASRHALESDYRGGSDMHATSVRIATSHHAPFDRMGLHEHESAYLSFVIAGEYVERVGSTRIDCVANRVRFHPLGEGHADNFGAGGGRCLNLELDPSWGPFVAELGLDDPCDAVLGGTGAWAAMPAWSAWRRERGSAALAVEEATASLLGACAKACFDAKSFVGHPGIRRAVD